MALDEQNDEDLKIESSGFNFVIEKDLSNAYNDLSIDYSDNWLRKGFIIGPMGASSC